MSEKVVFTIGHSSHDIKYFVELLKKQGVTWLIDVRSSPYSRIAPQFNKDRLRLTLKDEEISYVHFEKEFVARQTKPSLLDRDGRVDFDKVRKTDEFKQGVQRLQKAVDLGYIVSLMCSEADPFECHRFSMISYQLVKEDLRVYHILRDGKLVDNNELEERLLKKYYPKHDPNKPQFALNEEGEMSSEDTKKLIDEAYKKRGKDMAFSTLDACLKNL
ncbi:MAG: DUF488 domain-containing protein [Firmicutes bacterium]|nr:DUF488 domain-containing protein [Bacillota bacterium]